MCPIILSLGALGEESGWDLRVGPPPQAASALGTKNLVPGSWHQALGLGSPGSWHKDSGFVSVRRDAVRFMSNNPIVRLAVVVRISL